MADLQTIMRITWDELKRQLPVEQALRHALDALSERESDVLSRRYGLRDGHPQTLQQIGEQYGVTRERVRQIENQGLKKFATQLKTPPLADIVTLTLGMIRDQGGVIDRDILCEEFLPQSQRTQTGKHALSFLIAQLPDIVLVPENKHLHAFYARSAAHAKAVARIEPALVVELEKAKEPQSASALVDAVITRPAAAGVSYLIDRPFVEGTLEIGKRFVMATETTWGLASWSDINPRNIREKTLYVLKDGGTPLHFQDITDTIRDAKFDQKRVTVQAVHNELINGPEFILIGRGIYALAEWGYLSGTVADVIQTILKESEVPMDREAIIKAVLKQRHVSRNTILINLQEKSLFDRVDKHTYQLTPVRTEAKAGEPVQPGHPGRG